MGRGPVVPALQGPEVDDVAVEDELLAADAAEHVEQGTGLGVLGAEVEVRQEDGAERDLAGLRDRGIGGFHRHR